MASQTTPDNDSDNNSPNPDLPFLAVSSKHGWARHEDREQAVHEALQQSSYLNHRDEFTVTVYRCEPGTVVDGMGRIGVYVHDDGGEKVDLEEEKVDAMRHHMRGAEPLEELEERTYKYSDSWEEPETAEFQRVEA